MKEMLLLENVWCVGGRVRPVGLRHEYKNIRDGLVEERLKTLVRVKSEGDYDICLENILTILTFG